MCCPATLLTNEYGFITTTWPKRFTLNNIALLLCGKETRSTWEVSRRDETAVYKTVAAFLKLSILPEDVPILNLTVFGLCGGRPAASQGAIKQAQADDDFAQIHLGYFNHARVCGVHSRNRGVSWRLWIRAGLIRARETQHSYCINARLNSSPCLERFCLSNRHRLVESSDAERVERHITFTTGHATPLRHYSAITDWRKKTDRRRPVYSS